MSRWQSDDVSGKRRFCHCTTNYKSQSHVCLVMFLLFRTLDFLTCSLRCLTAPESCQDFSPANIYVLAGQAQVDTQALSGSSSSRFVCLCTPDTQWSDSVVV